MAKENILKFASANHCSASVNERNGHYYIAITKSGEKLEEEQNASHFSGQDTVYLISQDTLGNGNEELGAVLMKSLLYTLGETKPLPTNLIFINSGIKLTVTGSPVLAHLQSLAEQGVEILSCGTCLDYYHMKEKLAVGTVSNMYTIVEKLSGDAKVISL